MAFSQTVGSVILAETNKQNKNQLIGQIVDKTLIKLPFSFRHDTARRLQVRQCAECAGHGERPSVPDTPEVTDHEHRVLEAEDPGHVSLLRLGGWARASQEVSQPQDQCQELQLCSHQVLRLWIQSQSSAQEGGQASVDCRLYISDILNIRNIRSVRSSADTPPRSRRRRRPRPAPLSLEADTQTDESGSDQSSLKSSSLSPMSSPTMSPARARPAPLSPRSPRSPCSCVPLSSYKEAPRSPGVVRSTRCSPWMSPSPRSPSPYHSPGPSPRSPRQPFFPSPTYSPVYSPRSPSSMSRSPSPRPSHHAPLRSPQLSNPALGHHHQDNLSFLASRRKTSLASPRTLHNKTDKQVERRTSNFLELPGKVLSPFLRVIFHLPDKLCNQK